MIINSANLSFCGGLTNNKQKKSHKTPQNVRLIGKVLLTLQPKFRKILTFFMNFPRITAAEAASLIKNGQTLALSGFTPAGTPKATTAELAKVAHAEHEAGRPFQIRLLTGASTGASCDGCLSEENAIKYRAPYTTNSVFRKKVNNGEIAYNDIHLSHMAQEIRYGFLGEVDWAIIEVCAIEDDGKVYLTAAGGIAPTAARLAKKVIIELNAFHSAKSIGIHDVYEPADPPQREPIPIFHPGDRIGTTYLQIDPKKIVGVIESCIPEEARAFKEPDEEIMSIGHHVAELLANDMKVGRIPKQFLPIQSGVGTTGNAVLKALGTSKLIPRFNVYSEVVQDAAVDYMLEGRIGYASATAMTVTNEALQMVYNNMDYFSKHLTIRQSEIANSPEVIRRLGVIAINTPLECDFYGNENSSHVCGSALMNGIGGSCDYERNGYISIFTTPSTAKGGKISAIVPMCCHVDSTEHDVDIIVTEQGVADLRGKGPVRRAWEVIENCAHPDYKPLLRDYLKHIAPMGHEPQHMRAALAFHDTYLRKGDMRLTDFSEYLPK